MDVSLNYSSMQLRQDIHPSLSSFRYDLEAENTIFGEVLDKAVNQRESEYTIETNHITFCKKGKVIGSSAKATGYEVC